MMSVTRQTQHWSTSPQESTAPADPKNTVSAQDKEKYLNNEDVGSVLNKAADPNWVDPSKKMRAVGNNSLDKDAFLKLLLTQMKNQDPTNPLKSHEMSAQLAQFTSLEKLTNIDESISALRKDQAPTQNYEALNLIGKAVSGESSKIQHLNAKEPHAIRFQLKGDAQKVKVDLKDADGKIVRTLEFNNLKAGRNEVTWNGQLEDGSDARLGEYRAEINAKNSSGKKVWVETRFDGVITGLTFTPQGPLLNVGNQQIRLSDVDKIVAAPSMEASAPVSPPTSLQSGGESAPVSMKAPAPATNNLNDFAMSGPLMNQLKKEGAL